MLDLVPGIQTRKPRRLSPCWSRWGCGHLGTVLCEQLQSLLLISTQPWKTRWVLLASLWVCIWVCRQEPGPRSAAIHCVNVRCPFITCFVPPIWWLLQQNHVFYSVLQEMCWCLLSTVVPEARGRRMGLFGPTDCPFFWEGNGVWIIRLSDTSPHHLLSCFLHLCPLPLLFACSTLLALSKLS